MTNKFLKMFAGIALSAVCVVGVSACGSTSDDTSTDTDDGTLTTETGLTGTTAATVNGVEISEDKITKYINNIRINYGYDDDSDWADYLSAIGYTPEELRETILDNYIEEEITKQYASEMDVSTDDEEITSYVDQMKEQYSSDEAWESALTSSGYDDEDAYRSDLEYLILNKKLGEKFEEQAEEELTDDVLLESAGDYLSTYDGAKRSSHILFSSDDEETAQQVLDELNAGTITFEDAAAQYSTDSSGSDGGDVGWDCDNTFVDEYQAGLDELSAGQMSGLVQSDYGYHIILCTEEFTAPEELTSLDQIPDSILESIRSDVSQSNADTLLSDWLENKRDEADVVINDMPEGLPYDVEITEDDDESDDELSDSDTDVVLEDDVSSTDEDSSVEVDGEDIEISTSDASADADATVDEAEVEAEAE
jgi:foldase protein PrsA